MKIWEDTRQSTIEKLAYIVIKLMSTFSTIKMLVKTGKRLLKQSFWPHIYYTPLT